MRISEAVSVALALVLLTSAIRAATPVSPRAGDQAKPTAIRAPRAEILKVDGAVYMIAGQGGNVAAHVTDTAIVVVDTGPADVSEEVLKLISSASSSPIHFVINTSGDAGRIGGNARIAEAGSNIAITENGLGAGNSVWMRRLGLTNAPIVAHENAYSHIVMPESGVPSGDWPTSTFFSPHRGIYSGGEPIDLIHVPSAYSDGDLIVHFRKSDVIATGNVFSPDRFPMIDLKRGGSIEGTLAALNQLIRMAIPEFNLQGGTKIVPGYGRICNQADLVEYRNMVTIVRDRVLSMIEQGMNLEEIQKAEPALGYAGIYGRNVTGGSAHDFVEVLYRDLTSRPKSGSR